MYYRYEVSHPIHTNGNWVGVFQAFDPSQRRKWSCLHEPVWYREHNDTPSKAWFTEHGYQKWHERMDATIEDFNETYDNWVFRTITAAKLDNIVMKGKTQIIQAVRA